MTEIQNSNYIFFLQERKIKDIPCKDYVFFYPNGNVERTTLSQDYLLYKKDTEISFYENGQIETAFLKENVTIQKIPCKQDSQIFYHEDGRLEIATIYKKSIIANEMYEDEYSHYYDDHYIQYENGTVEIF